MFSWLRRRKKERERARLANQHRYQLLRLEQLEERLPLTTLLAGFSETHITTSGANLNRPTAMEFSPTGQLWALEQTGAVKVVNFATGGTSTAHTLTVNSAGERGLLGIAFPASYDGGGTNPDFVYLYYTATTPNVHNRLSRFDVANAGTTSPTLGAETIIMEVAPEPQGDGSSNHNGGTIHFGLDGNLYIAIGDHNADGSNFQGANHVSQRLDYQHGKILRINVNGDDFPATDRNYAIPADNPFISNTATWADESWALGLRNPFTFALQPGTGRLFINDVGEAAWEEINDAIAGSNFGWASEGTPDADGAGPRRAFAEGFVPTNELPLYVAPPALGTYSNPVMAYDHTNSLPTPAGFAITGGAFYPSGNQFGSAYAGKYFFADFVGNFIRVFDPITPGSTGTPDNSTAFASGLSGGSPVDLKVDAAGSLYYLAGAGGSSGEIYRISFNAPTLAAIPNQQFPASQDSITVTLNGSDPDVGETLTYSASLVLQGSALYNLDNQYRFYADAGGYYTNYRNQSEKYFRAQISATGYTSGIPWYYILSNGDVYEFTPSYANPSLVGVFLANMGTSVYNDPSLLLNAYENGPTITPPVMLTVSGNQMTIDPDPGYSGTFQVKARVTDSWGLYAEQMFAVTVTSGSVNQAPILAAISSQQFPSSQDSITVALSGSDLNAGDTLTFSASLVPQGSALYDLDNQFRFFADVGGYYTNYRSQNEKYFRAQVSANGYTSGTPWYYILSNGDVYEFTPSYANPSLVGVLLANVGTNVYSDPTLLLNAYENGPTITPPMTLTLSGNQLTIDPDPGYIGTFQVKSRVTDSGGLYAEQLFAVTVTSGPVNQAPTLAAITNQQFPSTQDSITVILSGSDPDAGDTLDYSASLVPQGSALYNLDNQYRFFADVGGYYTNYRNQNEKYFRAQVSANSYTSGTPWYYILSNGDMYEFTPSYANPSLVGVFLANVGTSVYNDPTLLLNAYENGPTITPPVTLTLSGNQLTIDPATGYTGTFLVKARVTDSGGLFAEQIFSVTVTAGSSSLTMSEASAMQLSLSNSQVKHIW